MNKRSRVFALLSMIMCVCLLLSACGGGQPTTTTPAATGGTTSQDSTQASSPQEVLTLTAAHTMSANEHYQRTFEKLNSLLEEKTDGRITLQIVPGGALGSERELIEGLQMGTVDMAIVSSSPVAEFIPELSVLSLPYVIRDIDHASAVFRGEIGQDLLDKFETLNIKALGFCNVGFRNVFSTKPVRSLADMAGVKIRVMESDVNMRTFSALGAIPVPMAYSELFTGLQQKTVDAAEIDIEAFVANKFYEVCPYYNLTKHLYGAAPLMISQSSLDLIPADLLPAFMEAAEEALDYNWQNTAEVADSLYADLGSQGIEVIELDTQPWADAVSDLYEEFSSIAPPELLQKILNT